MIDGRKLVVVIPGCIENVGDFAFFPAPVGRSPSERQRRAGDSIPPRSDP